MYWWTIAPRFIFPPTWTPIPPSPTYTSTDIPSPTFTPEYSLTPDYSSTPFITNTPVYLPQNQSFNGVGSYTTYHFTLPAGSIKITWSYSGIFNEDYYLKVAEYNHKLYLDQLESWYKSSKSYLESLLNDALRDRDALRVARIQNDLENLKSEYNSGVKKEDSRYNAEKNLYITTFELSVNKVTPSLTKHLVLKSGAGSGSVSYNAEGGYDYFLTIKTVGSWNVNVIP